MGKSFLFALPVTASLSLAAIAFGLSQQGQTPKGPIVAKNGIYSDADGRHIEVEGLCSADSEKIDCWSPSGKPMASLTNEIKTDLLTPSVTFTAHFQKRSILIVTQASLANQPYLQTSFSDKPQQGPYNYSQLQFGGFNGVSTSPGQNFCWYFADPKKQSFDLYCTFTSTFGGSKVLAPTIGSETTIKGFTLKIHEITPGIDNSPGGPYYSGQPPRKTQKTWTYSCEDLGATSQPDFVINLYPLDKEFSRIGFVDENGKPSDPSENRGYQRNSQSAVTLATSSGTPTPPNWVSDVDPQYVKAFDIEGTYQTQVEFPNLPLYPHR